MHVLNIDLRDTRVFTTLVARTKFLYPGGGSLLRLICMSEHILRSRMRFTSMIEYRSEGLYASPQGVNDVNRYTYSCVLHEPSSDTFIIDS